MSLQNPVSLGWSKLATLFQATQTPSQAEALENYQSDQFESTSIRQEFYPRFTDRVDPSLHYTIFFPYEWL